MQFVDINFLKLLILMSSKIYSIKVISLHVDLQLFFYTPILFLYTVTIYIMIS